MSDATAEPADAGPEVWPERVAVIGAGAMGGSLAEGLAAPGGARAPELELADVRSEAAEAAAAATGGRVRSAADAASADVVLLAVKPNDAGSVLEELAPHMRPDGVLVSVVAGLTLARMKAVVRQPAVRLMPSLAVRHREGLLVVSASSDEAWALRRITPLLSGLGDLIEVPEELFPAATAIVGSGPGLLALVAEGLEDGAVACGFTRHDAREMVAATLAGAAALLADGTDPSDLRQRVSSPAGTTLAGLAVLERGAVRAHLADAVRAATRRAAELE